MYRLASKLNNNQILTINFSSIKEALKFIADQPYCWYKVQNIKTGQVIRQGKAEAEVFIPELNKRNKTAVRGLWLSADHKLYYDYINVIKYPTINKAELQTIKDHYKQEAIFYIKDHKGYIFYGIDKAEDILPYRLQTRINKKAELKSILKDHLRLYNGCTIYRDKAGYLIEVFTKRKV